MKRFGVMFATMFALGLGVGASLSAYATDDTGCLASCQELLNDCRAQVVGDPVWNSQHCKAIYFACIADCSQ